MPLQLVLNNSRNHLPILLHRSRAGTNRQDRVRLQQPTLTFGRGIIIKPKQLEQADEQLHNVSSSIQGR
jgi:hypothetical protein